MAAANACDNHCGSLHNHSIVPSLRLGVRHNQWGTRDVVGNPCDVHLPPSVPVQPRRVCLGGGHDFHGGHRHHYHASIWHLTVSLREECISEGKIMRWLRIPLVWIYALLILIPVAV